MLRIPVVFASAAIGLAALAAPVPKEDDAARFARIYGAKSDPDRDAKFELAGEKLRITIPGRTLPEHTKPGQPVRAEQIASLSWKPTPVGAPRVWQDVKGDFTATVRVTFSRRPKAHAEVAWFPRAAGLVAWAGEKDHATVIRCEGQFGDRVNEEFRAMLTHSLGVRTSSGSLSKPDAAYLRMRRAGKLVTGSYSRDGKEWADFLPDEVEWPETLKVGVYATHLTETQFDVVFDEYTLTIQKK